MNQSEPIRYFSAETEKEVAARAEQYTRRKTSPLERKQARLADLQIHFYRLALIIIYTSLYTASIATIASGASGASEKSVTATIIGAASLIATASIHVYLMQKK